MLIMYPTGNEFKMSPENQQPIAEKSESFRNEAIKKKCARIFRALISKAIGNSKCT